MIVVDRHLQSVELDEVRGGDVLDVTDLVPRSGPNTLSARLFDWLDGLNGADGVGGDLRRYFALDGEAYWLHVRARIFYALYADARELDRLPDPARVGEATAVFCGADRAGFWRRWAPQARVVPAATSTRVPDLGPHSVRALVSTVWRTSRGPGDVLPILSDRPKGLFFSSSAANVPAVGGATDRVIGPLLEDPCSGRLRIEYRPPPTRGRARPRGGDSRHRTVSTNAIVATYVFRNPTEPVRLFRSYRELKRRFQVSPPGAPELGFGRAVWIDRFARAARDTIASIVQLHHYRRAFRWFLTETKPHYVVVVGESNAPGRTFVEEARKQRIVSYGIQHGTIDPGNVDYRSVGMNASCDTPDHFFAWGPRSKRFLVERGGWDADRIHVVGQLFSDTLSDPAPHAGALEFKRDQGRPLLFFASQQQPQVPQNRAAAAEGLARFCAVYDFCCVVKLHPGERADDVYERAFADAGVANRLRILDGDVYSMIGACDVGGTCYSTVIWEMMAMKRPVVVFDPYRLDWLGLRDTDSVLHVDDEDRFADWYANADRHVTANRLISEDVLGPRDGRVRERIERVLAAR